MAVAYGSSETRPCSCPDKQPFCTTCNTVCDKKIDAACAVYHLINPTAINHLTCLGLPNGVTVEEFMEAVDAAICRGITVTPVIHTLDTVTVDLTGDGSTSNPLTADVIVSPDSGNTISVHSNGLYATGGGTVDCAGIKATFSTDAAQKNAVDQTIYDFLITGTNGCELVSPPLGFAVTGPNRKSAFGKMEFFSTLALANSSAVSGETVILYENSSLNLALKTGVNYRGMNTSVMNVTGSSILSKLSDLVILGDLTIGGASNIMATNVDVFGVVIFSGSTRWRGGRFLDNTTNLNLQNTSAVSSVYSEKRVYVVEGASFTDFEINYSGTTGVGLSVNSVGDFIATAQRGSVYAPNLSVNDDGAALFAIALSGAKIILNSITAVTTSTNGMYLQCGAQNAPASLFATGLIGKSENASGIKVTASRGLGAPITNETTVVIESCTGYSVNSNGIFTIIGNLKHCTGISEIGNGILVGGSENSGENNLIIDCIGESRTGYGLKCNKDVHIYGGTYICRDNNTDGNPIFLSQFVFVNDLPNGGRFYKIIGVKTISRHPGVYAIKAEVGGIYAQISGCHFTCVALSSGAPGIDTLLLGTLRAASTDQYGNIR